MSSALSAIEKAKQIAAKLAAKRPHDYVEEEPTIEDPALAILEHQRLQEQRSFAQPKESSYDRYERPDRHDRDRQDRPGIGSTGQRPHKQSHVSATVKREATVPRHLVGLIVGRNGENLKKIERDYQVKCQVTQGISY
jgi:hypothetical protein